MDNKELLKNLINRMLELLPLIQDPTKKAETYYQICESIVKYISLYGKDDFILEKETDELQKTTPKKEQKANKKQAEEKAKANDDEDTNDGEDTNNDEETDSVAFINDDEETDNVAFINDDNELEYVEGFLESTEIDERRTAWMKKMIDHILAKKGEEKVNEYISEMSSGIYLCIKDLNENTFNTFISYLRDKCKSKKNQ